MTDAITAMGLPPGRHTLGQQVIEIQGLHAYVAGLSFLAVFKQINTNLTDKSLSFNSYAVCVLNSIVIIVSLLGTKTLSGSIATMDMCVRHFKQASGQLV